MPRLGNVLRRLQAHWFLWGLAAAVMLAWAAPGVGRRDGPLMPQLTTRLAVALVFLLHGANLPLAELRAGALKWRHHVLAQLMSFGFMPVLGLALHQAKLFPSHELNIGFVFLCALPTTITSAVVLTGIAGGNISIAVFNATLSSVLGVLLTPLWLTLVVRQSGGPQLAVVLRDLLLMLCVPLVTGQLLRPLYRSFQAQAQAHPHSLGWLARTLAAFDRWVVLFIVYSVFCDSFHARVWQRFLVGELLLTIALCAALLTATLGTTALLSRLASFERADTIAVGFVAATKSLAIGAPMAALLFPPTSMSGKAALGPLLLPLLIYHLLQLLVCGAIASRWASATFASSTPAASPTTDDPRA